MRAVASRVLYVAAMLCSLVAFFFAAHPLMALLPFGLIQFGITFTVAIAALLVGLRFEDQVLWKGYFAVGSADEVRIRNRVPPAPLAIGAAVGILTSLRLP